MKDEGLEALLHGTELFAGLDRDTADAVMQVATRARFRPGEKLIVQGDPAAFLHLVVKGRFKVAHITAEGEQVAIRFMGPGDPVGCAAVFRKIPYPATATATADSDVLSWSSAQIMVLLERFPKLAANALSLVSGRAEEFVGRMREMATEPVQKRLARTLLRLARDAGKGCGASGPAELPVTRQDLAELTGATLFTVSRIISGWEGEGIVRSGRKRVTVCDPAGLTRVIQKS